MSHYYSNVNIASEESLALLLVVVSHYEESRSRFHWQRDDISMAGIIWQMTELPSCLEDMHVSDHGLQASSKTVRWNAPMLSERRLDTVKSSFSHVVSTCVYDVIRTQGNEHRASCHITVWYIHATRVLGRRSN